MYGDVDDACADGLLPYGLLKLDGLLKFDGMYGLIGTMSGRVGINWRYWMGPCCALCGKYCIITGVGPILWRRRNDCIRWNENLDWMKPWKWN